MFGFSYYVFEIDCNQNIYETDLRNNEKEILSYIVSKSKQVGSALFQT